MPKNLLQKTRGLYLKVPSFQKKYLKTLQETKIQAPFVQVTTSKKKSINLMTFLLLLIHLQSMVCFLKEQLEEKIIITLKECTI